MLDFLYAFMNFAMTEYQTRDWTLINEVWLNPEKSQVEDKKDSKQLRHSLFDQSNDLVVRVPRGIPKP
jgi:archaellum component FlaC